VLTLLIALSLTIAGCQSSSAHTGQPQKAEAEAPVDAGVSATPASTSTSTKPTTPAPTVSIGHVTALRLADVHTGWIAGDGQIARTDDGGAHWKQQYAGSAAVLQLFALSSDKVWATLDNGSGKSAKLIRSTDGGSHWTAVGTVPNQSFLHFTNDKTAFSGSAVTKDGGVTWTETKKPASLVGDVYYHDAANGWAVQGGKGKFTFLHTSDGGRNWRVVMTRTSEVDPVGSVIRSTGANDAWIELIGDSGMTQTSYSLFHTTDGGKSWLPAIVKNGAGSGPAPGFTMEDSGHYPSGSGTGPGALYVVNPQTAFMGGQCMACDNPNTVAETTNGGKSWSVRKDELAGYGSQYIAATDASHVWLVATDHEQPSVLYTSADGGRSWRKAFAFDAL